MEGLVAGDEMEQERDQVEKRQRGALEGEARGRVSIPPWRDVEGDGAAEKDLTEETQSGVAVNLNFQGDPLVEKVLDLNRNGLGQRMRECCRILEEGCRFVEAGPVEVGGECVFVHTLADRGCTQCNQKLGRQGMQGCLFASENQCSYCATRGHHWVECPGRGVALCRKCMRGDHRDTACPKEY